jgi:type II secretory pathway component GspD/PulD (secretin)
VSILLGMTLSAGLPESAAALYKQARKAMDQGDYVQAYLLSSQAVAIDPETPEYWQFSQAVRTRGLAGVKIDIGTQAVEPAVEGVAGIAEQEIQQAREMRPPPVLKGAGGRKSFHLRADAKGLFEAVSKAYGLDVVFDSDFQAGAAVQFRLEDAEWKEALRAVESVTGSFLVALSEKLALVAKDTTQKRTELERVMTVLVPYDETTSPQELQEAARAIQSTFDMTKMGIDNSRKIVLFRDRVSRLRPALDLFHQLMVHRAQVVTEVELIAVNETASLNYGIKLPSSFTFTPVGVAEPVATPLSGDSASSSSSTIRLGSQISSISVGVTGTSFFASQAKGHVKSLIRAEMRGVDGQPAQLHLGDKYPVLTAGYFGRVEGPGQVYSPPPTINFEDLGIVLKVTPRVHGAAEVSLEIEAEFKTLTGEALNGIPVIANRKFTMRVRAGFDETAVISGLVRETLSQSWSGIPLLSLIPGLRTSDKPADHTELLLTLKPRLVNLPPSEIPTVAVRTGSETRPLTPLD